MNKTMVLIPTLNEAQGIGPTVKDILNEVENVEIIVVDQNSMDGTAQIAAKAGAKVITQLERGKGRAIAEGLLHTRISEPIWLAMFDGDHTFFARYIPQMTKILRERPDVGMVSGRQSVGYIERYTLSKRIMWVYLNPYGFLHHLLLILHRILNGVNMQCPLSGLRVIKYKCIKNFQPKSKDFDIEIEINCYVRKKGYKILEIPTKFRHREGKAKFHRFKHWLVIFRRIVIGSLE